MPNPITGNEGTFITRSEAKTMGANYTGSSRYSANDSIKSHLLGANRINDLLDQEDCVALRIYYVTNIEDSTDTPDIVVVGVDEDGNDLLDDDRILNHSMPCPPFCPGTGGSVMD